MTEDGKRLRAEVVVADGLATAMLAGDWTRTVLRARTKTALGRRSPPKWLAALVDLVLSTYPVPPVARPRELSAYLRTTPPWRMAWQHRRRPAIIDWAPVPLLDLDQGELAWFADLRGQQRHFVGPLAHYRWTTLPSGRLVAAPKPRLKEIQRRLLRHVLEPIPVHAAAHGSVREHSVRTAVAPHAGATVVIRADLTAFFASIRAGRVWSLLLTAGLPEAVAHTITGLVTTVAPAAVSRDPRLGTPHLPQGAPTSPRVANLIAFTLDRRLSGLAARFGARYTRYVDDLSFSGGPALRSARSRFVARVEQIVTDEGFRLNDSKTVVLGNSGRQSVLGAVVNDHPTLARPERDALRALLHNCRVHGWRSQARDHADLSAYVLGRISWANGLDPAFGARLRAAYDAIDWT